MLIMYNINVVRKGISYSWSDYSDPATAFLSGWRRVQWMKEYIWKYEDAIIVNALIAISVASINFAIAYAIIKKANRK